MLKKNDVFIITFALIILCGTCSCHNSQPYSWNLDRVDTGDIQYNSVQLVSVANSTKDIQLQLMSMDDNLSLHLQVQGYPFASYQSDESVCLVEVIIDSNDKFSVLATRHAGGHRLRIPEEQHSLFINALLKESTIDILTEGYKTRIQGIDFKENFEKLFNLAPFKLPVRFSL